MSIDFSKEENRSAIGDEYVVVGVYPRNKKNEATLIYQSGISLFDNILSETKFEDSDCILQISACENCILFILCYNNLSPVVVFGIWRKNILSFKILDNQEIKIPKFNHFKDSLPYVPIGGGLGAGLSQIIKTREAERQNFKVLGSKIDSGSIFELFYLDDDNVTEKSIVISSPSKYSQYSRNFFNIYWDSQHKQSQKQSKSNSSCYIATVCYDSPFALEVILLKFYRDSILRKYIWGRVLIKIYYVFSPKLAKYLGSNYFLKKQIKSRILDKIVSYLQKRYLHDHY